MEEKKVKKIKGEFDDLFDFSSKDDKTDHEARMIMFRFLGEVERYTGQKRGLKKQISSIIGKSKSFVTQLFRGDKMVNLYNLAKIQEGLGIKFRITAVPEQEFIYNYTDPPKKNTDRKIEYSISIDGESLIVSKQMVTDFYTIVNNSSDAKQLGQNLTSNPTVNTTSVSSQ